MLEEASITSTEEKNMKAIHIIKAAGGVACLTMALIANAQVTVTDSAASRPAATGGETTKEHLSDATITTKVKTSLATQSNLKSLHIHVKTRNGTVRLTGSVPDATQKSLAGETTANVSGVTSVRNNLKIVAQ
jgi:hyperosmotically inducible protein